MKTIACILTFLPLAALAADVTVGQKATVRATAEGNVETWELFKDGIKVADGPELVIASVEPSHAGTYRAKATNSLGSNEDETTLTVTAGEPTPTPMPPVVTITIDPVRESYLVGSLFKLTATATGATSLQWVRDDAYLSGATSSTYLVEAAYTSDAGIYSVIASNAAGFTRSNQIAVVISLPPVVLPPVITIAPVSIVVPKKGTARFSVTATNATSYQWYKGLTPIPGATSPMLTLANINPSSAGQYIVTVSNAGGYAKAGATLTVGR